MPRNRQNVLKFQHSRDIFQSWTHGTFSNFRNLCFFFSNLGISGILASFQKQSVQWHAYREPMAIELLFQLNGNLSFFQHAVTKASCVVACFVFLIAIIFRLQLWVSLQRSGPLPVAYQLSSVCPALSCAFDRRKIIVLVVMESWLCCYWL